MAALCSLLSAGLIEKDTAGDVLWTWSYPSVTDEQRELFIRKSGLDSKPESYLPFIYGQRKGIWYYIYTTSVQETDNLPKVTLFSLVLTAKDFHPEKYEALCMIFSKQYKRTANPATMLESYLGVLTKGTCNGEENGTFSLHNYDSKEAYANCPMKSFVDMFGLETILIYTAMMLKKRVVVFHPRLDKLLKCIRTIPAFVWHRQNWNILYPFLELMDQELVDLQSLNNYVAGFTDAMAEGSVSGQYNESIDLFYLDWPEDGTDLYDVFINLSSSQVSIVPQAKESLAMGKLHKDIAMAIVKAAENEDLSEHQVITEIAKKTKELLNNLKSLASSDGDGRAFITLEALQERKMPPATQNFLFNLASCEGMVKL